MSNFVCLKLITGEDLIGRMVEQTDDCLIIDHPVLVKIKTAMVDNHMVDNLTAAPFFPFSAYSQFEFLKDHVMFMQPLAEHIIPHYLRVIGVVTEEQEIEEYVRRIEEILQQPDEEPEPFKNFVNGNETKH